MPKQKFEGRSAAEAAISACEALGLTRSELKYNVVSETGELLSRRVIIEVDAPEGAARPAHAPQETAAPTGGRGRRGQGRRGPAERRDAAVPPAPVVPSDGTELTDEDEAEAAALQRRHDEQRTRPSRDNRDSRDHQGSGQRRGRGGRNGQRSQRQNHQERGERRQDDEGGAPAPRPPRQERPARTPRPSQADNGIDNLLKLVPAAPDVPRLPAIEPQGARSRRAVSMCRELLSLMGLSAETFLVEEAEAEFVVHMYGADEDRLIGKKGEVLLALQFIVNRMLSRNDEEGEQLMTLDAGGFRQRRRLALEGLAKTLAERAIAESKAVRLSPMSAHDRRVFHLALKEMTSVTTRSEGDGMFRNLLIIPTELV